MHDRRTPTPDLTSSNAIDNRRKQQRREHGIRVPIELWLNTTHDTDTVLHRCQGNIGRGGLFIEILRVPLLQDICTLKFRLPNDPEMIVARASRVPFAPHTDDAVRLQFLHIEGDGYARIERYIDTHTSSAVA